VTKTIDSPKKLKLEKLKPKKLKPKQLSIEAIPVRFDKRARSLKLRANTAGQISLTAPPSTPQFFIKRFIKQNQVWIFRHQDRASRIDSALTQNEVQLFGQKYQRKIGKIQDYLANGQTHPPGIFIDSKTIVYLAIDPEKSAEKLQTEFDSKLPAWLKRTCRTYISQRAHNLAKKMNIDFQKITLKKLKSRWGSCSARGSLNFNLHLVHFAPPIIDYVIIHELAHRVHLNHSPSFWKLVEKYDPKYKYHRRQLNKLAI